MLGRALILLYEKFDHMINKHARFDTLQKFRLHIVPTSQKTAWEEVVAATANVDAVKDVSQSPIDDHASGIAP
ncbi:hypothetical protein N7508_001275 [Penicillium antarcticum]|uniref:uncharacterized protein n=1 Tax=Penicillium antarcticum TaxID=416450 RepID=UPI00239BDA9A|nr:uncharacterized protein N7508_001275 [Penicillium antarcticum]KAJ5316767.1 hypothetical protein N7508_001275 [Penicillium antarcticum]